MALFDPPPKLERLPGPAAARALFAPLAAERREVAAFAYLDADHRLLGLRHTVSEAVDTLDLPLRRIAADALAFDAVALVMAHNHPSGDPTPSHADRDATRLLARTLGALDIRLLDHFVVASGGISSLSALGLF